MSWWSTAVDFETRHFVWCISTLPPLSLVRVQVKGNKISADNSATIASHAWQTDFPLLFSGKFV